MPLLHWPAVVAFVVALLVQTPPVPKPFPQPGQGSTPSPAKVDPAPVKPATPSQQTQTVPQMPAGQAPSNTSGAPTAATLGAPIYPTSEFLESFDAGKGQRYYLFGTNAAYIDIVAYYKTIMKSGGRTIMDAPAMQQFDLGKFQDQTMAYPPSVTVKDYSWGGSTGYLVVDGTKEKRFKTVIQIVPATAAIK